MTEGRTPLVLVCDDEPVLRELVVVALGGGYRVCEAGTVEEALAAIAAEPPDAVVLDLMVPGGGGIVVLRDLRRSSELHDVPVVVVSAWSDEAHREEAELAGADVFLAKPFDPGELEQRVAGLVGARRRRGAGAET
ncbi:MAG TPA: response regulator [Gaiellaceae bacterium]|nr:response regulator [Gaiellaceae bacterium]